MTGTQIGAELGRNYTTADITEGRGHTLGDRHIDTDGKEYIFVIASAALPQYDVAWMKANHEAKPMTAALALTSGKMVIPQLSIAVDTYGWAQYRGQGIVSVIAAAAPDVSLYMSATAGHLDDTTLSINVLGIILMSAEASSMAACYMDNIVVSPHAATAGS